MLGQRMAEDSDRKALESFVLDNPELAQLEALLNEFNIFEAIGAVRQEVRHSDFLAFLLNPQERHGLDADFAQQLLLTAVGNSEEEGEVTAVDLALWDLSEIQVLREWQHIDILLLDETNRLAVIIENKVGSGEHSQQLQRYWRIVRQRYPGWHILGLFLSPDGHEPSDDRYLSVDYGQVQDLVNTLTESRASTLGADIRTLMRHYAQMLRRHIMPDSDIAQLAQRIYKKHQHALDLIFEHRPDLQAGLRDYLEKMVQETPGIQLEYSTKTWIRSLPLDWSAPVLQQGTGKDWGTSSQCLLLLEFGNESDRLHLKVTIGPGPQDIRERLFNLALDNVPPFKVGKKRGASIRGKHKAIFVEDFLRASDYEGAGLEDLTPKVQKKWENFVKIILPQMTAVLQSATWLWEENAPEN